MERNIGFSSRSAFSNASLPHGYQSTGLNACWRRYGLFSWMSRFDFLPSLSCSWTNVDEVFMPLFPRTGDCAACSRSIILNETVAMIPPNVHNPTINIDFRLTRFSSYSSPEAQNKKGRSKKRPSSISHPSVFRICFGFRY